MLAHRELITGGIKNGSLAAGSFSQHVGPQGHAPLGYSRRLTTYRCHKGDHYSKTFGHNGYRPLFSASARAKTPARLGNEADLN